MLMKGVFGGRLNGVSDDLLCRGVSAELDGIWWIKTENTHFVIPAQAGIQTPDFRNALGLIQAQIPGFPPARE